MLKPCLDCGRLAQRSRCRICQSKRDKTNPYTRPEWRQLSLAVVVRDGRCVQCGATSGLQAHHVIPRAEGGPDALGISSPCASSATDGQPPTSDVPEHTGPFRDDSARTV